jgi:hypothetical protein
MASSDLISTERIYRTASGEICDEGDPNAAFLVVSANKPVPAEYVERVKAYGGISRPGTKMITDPAEAAREAGAVAASEVLEVAAAERAADLPRPPKNAKKAEWVAFRTRQGYSVDALSALSASDLHDLPDVPDIGPDGTIHTED